ncbi:MAG TPA: L,D-transpeptidase family protein [Steroidobacteraceae bacterium]|nr:L,D-transpeptidase family protein [Steroidobacteraceae bacterium]
MNSPTDRHCSRALSRRAATAAITALAALAALAGCSLLRPPPPPPSGPAPPTVVAPVAELARAQATHRFEIDAAREDIVGVVQSTVIGKEDTLPDVARRFNVGYEEMVRANPGVDPWLPGAGREVIVPTRFVLPDAPREGVVINVAAMRLYYYPTHAKGTPQVVITHPIGIGKVGWQTPEGATKIVARVRDPVWVPPVSVRKEHAEDGDLLPAKVPAGPDNPLGAYMFRLGWPSYLIHGTNKPYGVGMRSSHGCIRLYPEDIAILFETVPIGTPVRVVNQPYLLGWQDDELYVEAYGALEDDKRDWQHGPKSLLKKAGKTPLWKKIRAHDADIDWERARLLSESPRGVPVSVMRRDADSLEAAVASARKVRNELPMGATWDGQTGLLIDEKQFAEMLGEREPSATTSPAAPQTTTAAAAPH